MYNQFAHTHKDIRESKEYRAARQKWQRAHEQGRFYSKTKEVTLEIKNTNYGIFPTKHAAQCFFDMQEIIDENIFGQILKGNQILKVL